MKRTAALVVVMLVAAGLAGAQQETSPVTVTGEDELEKQKSKLWEEVWVKPDADISDYDKLHVWQTVFQFRDLGDRPVNQTTTALMRGDQGYFEISAESRAKFEQIVSEVVVKELNRSKQFDVVDTVGPGTLLVRALVLDIVSNVPPDIGRRANVHLSNMGEATFVFELIDADTGVIQARVGDRRMIQPPARMNELNPVPATTATVWNDVELWANDQALTLRRELDKLAKKAAKN